MKITNIKVVEFEPEKRPEIVDMWYMKQKNGRLLDTHLTRCFPKSVDRLGYIDTIVSLINDSDIDTIIIKKYHKVE